MNLIENQNPPGFSKYLEETHNTICGRNPIKLLLSTINHSKLKVKTQFVQYDQSSKVKTEDDSSVSYAAAVTSMI